MKLLVSGGRDFEDRVWAYKILDVIHSRHQVSLVIEGGQRGADRIGRDWAVARGIEYRTFEAEWKGYAENRAGHRRNQRMLDEGQPDAVLALPGSRGTRDMLRRTREYVARNSHRFVRVWDIAMIKAYVSLDRVAAELPIG